MSMLKDAHITIHASGENATGFQLNASTGSKDEGERQERDSSRDITQARGGSNPPDLESAPFKYTDRVPPESTAFSRSADEKTGPVTYNLKQKGVRKKGKVVIFNVPFTNEPNERKGSEIDVLNMKKLWAGMGFEVNVVDSAIVTTAATIQSVLRQVAGSYGGIGAVVVIIMSHGRHANGYDEFQTSDNRFIKFDDVIAMFDNKNAKSLQGIPKIFFSQFCRGTNKDYGVEEEDDDELVREFSLLNWNRSAGDVEQEESSDSILPLRSDILIAHASMPGYKAMRNPEKGSWFFNAITNVFARHAENEHILELMTRVNAAMSEKTYTDREGKTRKQMGEVKFDLTKTLRLMP